MSTFDWFKSILPKVFRRGNKNPAQIPGDWPEKSEQPPLPAQPSTQTRLRRQPGETTRLWLAISAGLAMLVAGLLPLNLLATRPFHHDEALYATWALEITSGENPFLAQTPIDKPPLFLYTVAGTLWLFGNTETSARLPSLLFTVLTVGLTFWLGHKLYGNYVGGLAAWLVALSPFTILFAPTAFTDPMLVMLVLAACLAAVYVQSLLAGMFLGLAIVTKQQGVFYAPLVVMVLLLRVKYQGARGKGQGARVKRQVSGGKSQIIRKTQYAIRNFFIAAILVLALVFLWDFNRDQSPGFWQLSLINYGGLNTGSQNFGARWAGFIELLTYATAAPVLNTIFLTGLPLLLIWNTYHIINKKQSLATNRPIYQPATLQVQTDWLFSFFSLIFILVHSWFSFQVWDRYLLGLIPFLALLLARILWLPWLILKEVWLDRRPRLLSIVRPVLGLSLICLLGLSLGRPVQDAVNGRYPLGSNSGALRGIDQLVAYLQGHAGATTTLYHRWLGTHWRYYLWHYPYDLQYWPSAEFLAGQAQPGQLIVFPSWRSETEARLALAENNLALQELSRAYTPAGNPSLVLYQIVKRGNRG
ncbi:MAG: glycosyltransferase family 39 protein [Anaerolineae bacterium]|nr:glycosyltransferase family 39 protein [Anaerolineae bacterium]